MKRLLTVIILIPLFATAQPTKSKTDKKALIGFSFSSDYANRTLINNDGNSSNDMVIDVRNKNEEGKLGITTGFNLISRIAKKLEFQTAIVYSNNGYRIPKRPTYYPIPERGQPTHYKSKASFHYIQIPLKLNFVTGNNKIKFIAGAGIAANFLVSKSDMITFFYDDGSKKKTDQSDGFDYKKFNLFALASAGVQCKLNKNILLKAEPTFRYGLLKIIDMPVTAKLWNVGLNVGVYLNL